MTPILFDKHLNIKIEYTSYRISSRVSLIGRKTPQVIDSATRVHWGYVYALLGLGLMAEMSTKIMIILMVISKHIESTYKFHKVFKR